jgi:hypothetical protein
MTYEMRAAQSSPLALRRVLLEASHGAGSTGQRITGAYLAPDPARRSTLAVRSEWIYTKNNLLEETL